MSFNAQKHRGKGKPVAFPVATYPNSENWEDWFVVAGKEYSLPEYGEDGIDYQHAGVAPNWRNQGELSAILSNLLNENTDWDCVYLENYYGQATWALTRSGWRYHCGAQLPRNHKLFSL